MHLSALSAPRLQVVPRADRAALLPGRRRDRRPERLRQVEHLRLAAVGDGGSRAEHAARASAGTDVLFAGHGRPSGSGRVRGRARARQLATAAFELPHGEISVMRRLHRDGDVRVPARSAGRAPPRGAGGARRRGPRARPALRDLAGQRRRGAARPSRGAPRADRGGRRSRQVPAPPSARAGAARPRARRPRARRRHRARDPARGCARCSCRRRPPSAPR